MLNVCIVNKSNWRWTILTTLKSCYELLIPQKVVKLDCCLWSCLLSKTIEENMLPKHALALGSFIFVHFLLTHHFVSRQTCQLLKYSKLKKRFYGCAVYNECNAKQLNSLFLLLRLFRILECKRYNRKYKEYLHPIALHWV